ncbi:TetR/AcrR family transcriptional regulator [Microbacterium gallinarum]|jgi:AcrR family transcriptional regulator|uniref:TetR/AcrR family transcriptional regulator n=1 Tax=Microbacterium gallinarum TaxID=2762209 RepID=A0ABR8WZ97_9MICO|nr:TetR family transcriptional regulator [Microbacterium gallinarum]MBD8022412.1 TetR/AcrR family transcriptional regulator [Microbacterium gallinarum]
MTSSTVSSRSRKRPEERRAEILAAAADIALEEGLERITLRAVADRLGVRPGLITHYFPAADELVLEAFERAAVGERGRFFPADGTPVERLAHFIDHVESGASLALARLWLNARHLSRFSPALDTLLQEQDALDQTQLIALIRDGITSGDFVDVDAEAASIRIFIAVDGGGSYVNTTAVIDHPAHVHFARDVAEWTLGLDSGTLERAQEIAQLRGRQPRNGPGPGSRTSPA